MASIFLSAGEASGEHYGAALMAALRAHLPDAQFSGLGGASMREAGCDCIVRAEDVAVMGITEVIHHMPRIYARYRRLTAHLRRNPPDIAILIDFPDVNLRLAKTLRRLNVPVVYFVSPQLWAWKKRRIHWVQQRVTKMLVIFPFEAPFYREHGVAAEFVGHPLADLPTPQISREEFAQTWHLDASKPWIGLLPGSRARELRLNLPVMAQAAALLGDGYEYLLPVAPTLDEAWVRAEVARMAARGRIHVVQDARAVLHHARASIVASGTATVQAALIGNPFIAVYRLSTLSYAVASRLVKLPHVAMPNLIVGRRIVPELIQHDFTAANTVNALRPLLEDGPARQTMMRDLRAVREALHPENSLSGATAIDRAADAAVSLLAERRPQIGMAPR
jgi:lipid-A-disaccharide synthase